MPYDDVIQALLDALMYAPSLSVVGIIIVLLLIVLVAKLISGDSGGE